MATPVQDAWYDFLPTCSEMGKLTKGEQDRLFGLLKDKVAITPNALAKDESDWNDTLKEVGITSSQDRGVIKIGLRKLQDKTESADESFSTLKKVVDYLAYAVGYTEYIRGSRNAPPPEIVDKVSGVLNDPDQSSAMKQTSSVMKQTSTDQILTDQTLTDQTLTDQTLMDQTLMDQTSTTV